MLNVLVYCPETVMREQIADVLASKNFAMLNETEWTSCLDRLSRKKDNIRMALLQLPREPDRQRQAYDQALAQASDLPLIFLVDDWFDSLDLDPLATDVKVSMTRLCLPFTSDELNQKIEFLADQIRYE